MLGLPAGTIIEVSLAATAVEGAEEPPGINDNDDAVCPLKGHASFNYDMMCSPEFRFGLQLRELFLRCKAPRTLALGVKKHLACSDDSFSIVDFLRGQVAEPPGLVAVQFFDYACLLRRPLIRIVDAISFKSWDLFCFARDILLDLLDGLAAEHGQEFINKPENLGIIEDEWLRRLWAGRAGHDAKGKKRSKAPFEFRQAVEIAGRWMNGGAEQRCSCGGIDGFHSEAKVFGRGEIYDGIWLAHYLLMALRSKTPLEHCLHWPSYARSAIAYGSKRKLQLRPEAFLSLTQAPRFASCLHGTHGTKFAGSKGVPQDWPVQATMAARPATCYGTQGCRQSHEALPRKDAPSPPHPAGQERALALI